MIENSRDRYIVARWAYLCGEPIISDIEFDKLDKEFKSDPNDTFAHTSWAYDKCPIELLKKYNLSHLIQDTTMGYMAESIPSITTEDELKARFGYLNKPSRISFKIDGWNTRVSYFNGVLVEVSSRGRSGNSLSLNDIAGLFPKSIPYKGKVAITGELSIPNSQWQIYKSITGNSDQRASVRTAIARKDVQYLEFLAFKIVGSELPMEMNNYDTLHELGFKTPTMRMINTFSELRAAIRAFSVLAGSYNYLTDGLVIENEDLQLALRLGEWKEKPIASFVTGYTEQPGMFKISMIVNAYPITREGKTFKRVNIVNIAAIEDNNLRIGAPIAFAVRSSANVVIDTTMTHLLQQKYAGRYDEYKNIILNGGNV